MPRIFNTFISLVLLGGLPLASALAQSGETASQQGARAAVPRLITVPHLQSADQAIQLKSLRLRADISGGLAQTTVEMMFFNPNGRNLEGNLQFPLLAGQQISAFALDIDGKLRSAVPVAKAQGQKIFEEVQRQRVDPGLLEATEGNNFRLRIFPIPPRGTRTVQIKYTEALARQGQQWTYRMPLAYGEGWQEFTLDIALQDISAAPQVSGALANLVFVKNGRRCGRSPHACAMFYQAHFAKSPFNAKGDLHLQIPASAEPQIFTQVKDDTTWFLAEVPVSPERAARVLPQRVGLLWDASGSGAKRDHEAEFAELGRYFAALGNADVHLTFLRDTAEDGGTFKIVKGNWANLQEALRKTVYDGASALGDWPVTPETQEYLLVSDGLSNYGIKPFPVQTLLALTQKNYLSCLDDQRNTTGREKAVSCVIPRLYALNSAQAADTARLSGWAEATGGKLVQINPQNPGAAAAMLLTEGVHLNQLSASGASDLQVESHEAHDGLLRVAGRLTSRAAQINVQLSKNGQLETLQLPINSQTSAPHPFAATLWANYKLRTLEADLEIHRAEIKRIGQQFGLATRETSLLVLERLEDYVRYDLTPPADSLAAYEQLKQSTSVQKIQERAKHMDTVVQLFNAKVAWWEKDFPKDALIAKQKKEMKDGMALLAPAAMPAPSPRMARVSKSAESAGQTNAVPEIGISLKKWTANAPYIDRLKMAAPDKIYAVYLDEKPGYLKSSAFYLDAADLLQEKGQSALALRVLSNIAEMDLENRALLRILGYRLLQAGATPLALPIFEKIVRLAPEEPQSFRDLGLAYAADKQYQKAIDQLNTVVERTWDGRFPEIESIVLAEMNALIAEAGKKSAVKLDLSRIDPRLIKNLPLDLRVIMTWDADNTDMDLWVTDPNGERCFFGFPLTYQGGRMSRDFTGGYGPEEFSLKTAIPGKYKIEANFYGNSQQVIASATTVQVKVSSHFGTPKQQEQLMTLRLQERRDTVFVGEFEVKP